VKLPDNDFFKKVDDIMDYAIPFTIIWMIVMWLVSNKQQRALASERKKRVQEEEINRITSAQKSQLEVMVAERTAELTQQKEELQQALSELKNTQSQLIHSEKMASLGELTAGIAHEIQNPLNFVNNFAEVNMELIDELKQESHQGKVEMVSALAKDIRQNLEKISYHGKRADAIVKGMLQHSRTSTGQKEDVDINTLIEEYVGLSYHGMRAKDKSFNVAIKSKLDPNAGIVKIIPQDIGRVLLNVFNNAFYSVKEKKQEQIPGFEPTVNISTKKVNGEVEIRVRDNGNGIPEKILDKIFQPFFTTKPTGQGTGLGLSLSYDIINKVHGGRMYINTVEGQYAEFIILLPVS
jgi:signal transduction histidine kinase